MNGDKKFIIAGLVGGFIVLAAIFGYAGQGFVRPFNIFWPEEVRQTLEFRTLDGKTVVVGTVGNAGTNPELIMRTGDYTYIITAVNKDIAPHQLFVEGPDIGTKLLEPGESDKIILQSKNEVTFNYYDIAEGKEFLGTIRAVQVTPFE